MLTFIAHHPKAKRYPALKINENPAFAKIVIFHETVAQSIKKSGCFLAYSTSVAALSLYLLIKL